MMLFCHYTSLQFGADEQQITDKLQSMVVKFSGGSSSNTTEHIHGSGGNGYIEPTGGKSNPGAAVLMT